MIYVLNAVWNTQQLDVMSFHSWLLLLGSICGLPSSCFVFWASALSWRRRMPSWRPEQPGCSSGSFCLWSAGGGTDSENTTKQMCCYNYSRYWCLLLTWSVTTVVIAKQQHTAWLSGFAKWHNIWEIVSKLPEHVWGLLELSSICQVHGFWSNTTATETPCLSLTEFTTAVGKRP